MTVIGIRIGVPATAGNGGGAPDLQYAYTFNGDMFTFGDLAFTYGAP